MDSVSLAPGTLQPDAQSPHEVQTAGLMVSFAGRSKWPANRCRASAVTVIGLEFAFLLGGLIVKIGSRQIDTSLRTKLSTLKLALKEVG